MKFSIITVAVATLVGSVSAAPSAVEARSSELETRAWPPTGNGKWSSIFFCAKPYWGECQNFGIELERCYNIADMKSDGKPGSNFLGNLNSVGPESSATCTLYSAVNCQTNKDRLYVNYPGYDHLDGHDWQNKAKSLVCWPGNGGR